MIKPAWVEPRCGKVYKFRHISFYACEGLIAMVNERNGEYLALKPNDFLERVKALYLYVRKMQGSQDGFERDEWRDINRLREDALACYQEAKDMGDPSDPAVAEHWRKHVAGRKNTISVAQYLGQRDPEGYPKLWLPGGVDVPQRIVPRDETRVKEQPIAKLKERRPWIKDE